MSESVLVYTLDNGVALLSLNRPEKRNALNRELVQALKDQLERVCVTSRAFYNDQYGPFCRELAEFCEMDSFVLNA